MQQLADSPGINALRHPVHAWPTTDLLVKQIEQQLHDHPFRYLADLQCSGRELVHSLRLMKCELAEMGHSSSLFYKHSGKIEDALSLLNNFLVHAAVLPHDKAAFGALEASVNELQRTISCLVLRSPDPSAVANLLDRQIENFAECADQFFAYEVRKYAVYAVGGAPHQPVALSTPYSTLNQLARDPGGVVFDVDDCVAFSEKAQKAGWETALRAWAMAPQHGFARKDPDGVEKLCRTVRYCLETDTTHELLELLCDICERRGFAFEIPRGLSAPVALERGLIPFRGKVMVDSVKSGAVTFTPGAYNLLMRLWLDEKSLGLCTNTPCGVSEPMLRALFERGNSMFSFDEIFPAGARVYGDTTPLRKPFPLMWLEATRRLGLRPKEVMIYDNSLNNCLGATDLSRYVDDQRIHGYGDDLLGQHEEFAAVVGVTNGVRAIDPWRSWAVESPRRPVKIVVSGLDQIEV